MTKHLLRLLSKHDSALALYQILRLHTFRIQACGLPLWMPSWKGKHCIFNRQTHSDYVHFHLL